MLRYLRWTLRAILALAVLAFLHYTLPQRDIVRIVNTYEERQDFGWNAIFWSGPSTGGADVPNRDVLFIQTIQEDGDPMVYRNEDTGWGWPPYFKFDTANLQTEAADAVSSRDDPRWYAIRHYGWRIPLFSAFPNAVSIEPVAGPEVRLIPWFNIVFVTLLVIVFLVLRRFWIMFRERTIDPLFDRRGG
ncbi:DUF1523 family protein [Tranquillimonas alkanivorans]|uniref:DUF1523 domain-containing protein n=1 Tax=Tranquillimonas alkanivorans TaxID=441119 RepID=A0A1I5M292_9RHOB|nr:DUF1523 family protein [Tranquillimonas alkanivorans]SFP03758.1 Protein of unknown function [Tranquillimonas alkanivorans]